MFWQQFYPIFHLCFHHALHLKLTALASKSAKSKLKPCRHAPDSTSPSHDFSRLSVNATEASNHTPPFWAKTSTRNTSLIWAGPTDVKREASEPRIKLRDSELKKFSSVCWDSTWICQSGFWRRQLSCVVCTLGGKVGLSQYVKICFGIFEGPEISVAVSNVGSNPDTVSTAIHKDSTKLMATLSETVSVPTYFWYKADVPSSHSAWFMTVLKMCLGAKCIGNISSELNLHESASYHGVIPSHPLVWCHILQHDQFHNHQPLRPSLNQLPRTVLTVPSCFGILLAFQVFLT